MPLMGLPPFPWGVPAGVPKCGAVPGNLFPDFVLNVFSLGTPLRNKNVLRPIEGNPDLVIRPFPAQPSEDARQLVAVGAAQVGPFLAEALAPDLHVGHAGALHRTLLLQTAEIGAGEEIAAFKEVHLRPAFRQQGVQILPHQPLALIGLHGFPLLVLGQRVHFADR